MRPMGMVVRIGCGTAIIEEIAEQMIFERILQTARAAEPLLLVEPESGGAVQHAASNGAGAALGVGAAKDELFPCDGAFPFFSREACTLRFLLAVSEVNAINYG